MEEKPIAHEPVAEPSQEEPKKTSLILSRKLLWVGLAILGLLLAGVGAFFLSRQSTEIKPQVSQVPLEKVKIGNVGEYSIFNLIALEQGYFKENGLDATIIEYTSGPASLTGLFAGETDINIAADFVGVRNIFDHPELRILAQANQHRVFQLVSRKDLGIIKPQDLKGKKVGVTKNSAGEYFLGNFLSENNLKLEDVIRVDLTPPDMVAQLGSGQVDAIVIFEPHVYKLKNTLGEKFVSWDVQGNQNISALVYTTEPFIKAHPTIVENYMKSLVQAEAYYESNPEAVKKFVGQKLKYEDAYIAYSWPKFTHAITLNQELLLNMENEARWVIKNKLTDQTSVPNYLNFIYFDPLEKAKPDGITIVH